jgi:prepilin-type processing-associated H-X9-DG protein
MPIPFTCPHCRTHSNVDERFAGQSGPCAHCGKTIQIPHVAGFNIASAAPAGKSSGMGIAVVVSIVLGLLLLCACGVGLVGLGRMSFTSTVPVAMRSASQSDLRQVGLAFHNYHDAWGTLPPAWLADTEGQPLVSWRVLLAPYLEAEDVLNAYDMTQPWDSASNQLLVERIPSAYRSPSASMSQTTSDVYVVTGQGFIFDGTQSVRFTDIVDGLASTIIAVEVVGHPVNWTEPRDFTETDLDGGLLSPGASGINVLMADGSVRYLDASMINSATLRPYFTRDGSEVVPPL